MANAVVRTSIKKRNGEGLDELNLYLASLKKELEELTKSQTELDAKIYEISDTEWNEETAKINKAKKRLVKDISEAKAAVDELKRTINDEFISFLDVIANTRDPEKDYDTNYEQSTTLASHILENPRLILDALKLKNPYGYTASSPEAEPKEEVKEEVEEKAKEVSLKRTRKRAKTKTPKADSDQVTLNLEQAPASNPILEETKLEEHPTSKSPETSASPEVATTGVTLNVDDALRESEGATLNLDEQRESVLPKPSLEPESLESAESNLDTLASGSAVIEDATSKAQEVATGATINIGEILDRKEPEPKVENPNPEPAVVPTIEDSNGQFTIESLTETMEPEVLETPEIREADIETLEVLPEEAPEQLTLDNLLAAQSLEGAEIESLEEEPAPVKESEATSPKLPEVNGELLRIATGLASKKEIPEPVVADSTSKVVEVPTMQLTNRELLEQIAKKAVVESEPIIKEAKPINILDLVQDIKATDNVSEASGLNPEFITKIPTSAWVNYNESQPENLWDEDASIKALKQTIDAIEQENARLKAELAKKEQAHQEKVIQASARLELENDSLVSLQIPTNAYENIDYENLADWDTSIEDKSKMPTKSWINYNPALPALIQDEDKSIRDLKEMIALREAAIKKYKEALTAKIAQRAAKKNRELKNGQIIKLTETLKTYLALRVKDEEEKAKKAEALAASYESETEDLESLVEPDTYKVDYDSITEYNVQASKGVVLNTNKIDKLKIYNDFIERNRHKKSESAILLNHLNKTPKKEWINLNPSLPSTIYDDSSITRFRSAIEKKAALEKIKQDLAKIKEETAKPVAPVATETPAPVATTTPKSSAEEVSDINAFLAQLEARRKCLDEVMSSINEELTSTPEDLTNPELISEKKDGIPNPEADAIKTIEKIRNRKEKSGKLNKMLNALSGAVREIFTVDTKITPHGNIDSRQILETIKNIEDSELDFLGRANMTGELYKTNFEKAVTRHITIILTLERAISLLEKYLEQEHRKLSSKDLGYVEIRIHEYRNRVNSVRKALSIEFAKQYYQALKDMDYERAEGYRKNILGFVGVDIKIIPTLEKAIETIDELPVDDKEKIASLAAEENSMQILNDSGDLDSTQPLEIIRKLKEQYTKLNNGRKRG